MPDHWQETTLGAISVDGLFTDGDWVESKDQHPDGTNRLLQLADVGDGVFLNKSDRWMTDEQFERLRCTPVEGGDVLIARMPDPIARACLVPVGLPRSCVAVDVAICRPARERVLPDLLMMLINDNRFRAAAEARASGTTRQRVSRKNLAAIPFYLPPMPEQRRIVDVVGPIDSYISALEDQLGATRNARAAVLYDLLSHPGDDWQETTLGDVARWSSGGTPKASEPDFYGGGIPWCVIGDLTEGWVDSTEKTLTESGLKASSAKVVPAGTVMIAMYGASIGRTGMSALPIATNQAIATAQVDESMIQNRFLLLFLQSRKRDFVDRGTGNAQPNISQTILREWDLALPPLFEQERIVDVVGSFDVQVEALVVQLGAAQRLRSGVLSELLSGVRLLDESYGVVVGL